MDIENGNVVVIRDGDTVRGVFYRKFYADVEDMADDITNFVEDKQLESANISVMEIQDGKFCRVEEENFRLEFFPLLKELGFSGYAMCEQCDMPLFVWLDGRNKAYCHGCKEVFGEDE